MKLYTLLKFNRFFKNHRIKFLALFLLHIFKQRYIAVHFDPINACNLRCKMCYFTDKDYVKKLKGSFLKQDLPILGRTILNRALKLQVGCGTEPTLYKDLDQVFLVAKKYKVPHISLTTNANLLTKEKLDYWVDCGLHEIIISLHGVYQSSYEDFMQKGNYEKLHQALSAIHQVKKRKNLSLRINYTFNKDNFKELTSFFHVFGNYPINTLQLRPIINLGNTTYQDFDLEEVYPFYNTTLASIQSQCTKRSITLIAAPSIENLVSRKNEQGLIYNYTYCYISPTDFWHKDFNWRQETYDIYAKRKKISKELWQNIFVSANQIKNLQTEHLNYKIG